MYCSSSGNSAHATHWSVVNVGGCIRRGPDVIRAKRARFSPRTCPCYVTASSHSQTALESLTTRLFRRCEKRHGQLHVSAKPPNSLSLRRISTYTRRPKHGQTLAPRSFPSPPVNVVRWLDDFGHPADCATLTRNAYACSNTIRLRNASTTAIRCFRRCRQSCRPC